MIQILKTKKDKGLSLTAGLTLHRWPILPFKLEEVQDDLISFESDSNSFEDLLLQCKRATKQCCRPDVLKSGWTAGWKHVLWDPIGHIKCRICKKGENEHQILACD